MKLIFIITELAVNNLSYFIEKKSLNLEEKYQIIFDICTQVYLLHKELLAHRDIKPDNILIFV